jgi:F-type H+-transporting ATPase subunit gamma
MQGSREFNRKIKSLGNTRKITGSMKMISSVKMRRYTRLKQDFAPYFETVNAVRQRVSCAFNECGSLFVKGYEKPVNALVVVVTGDRGLCGQLNANAIREAARLNEQLRSLHRQSSIACIGVKGYAFFQKRKLAPQMLIEKAAKYANWDASAKLADHLIDRFVKGDYHEIWIVYSRRESVLSEKPVSEMLLPLRAAALNHGFSARAVDYLVEEPAHALIESAVRTYLRAALYRIALESSLAENSSRMAAMESASDNCDRMIHKYRQLGNRARQAAVTTELSEIVTGKEALES